VFLHFDPELLHPGGLFADFFTTAVRTDPDPDSGMGGVELLLIEKSMPGVGILENQA